MIDDIYELHGHPEMSDPVMLVALEGWIDSGSAAANAMASLLDSLDTEIVATFDTDQLLDHRARRPVMTLHEGLMDELTWPAIELHAALDDNGRHLLLLAGAEPDHCWGRFTDGIRDLIVDLEVSTVVGLGAYPAPVPHTRETRLALTSPTAEVLEAYTGFVRGSVEIPAGIQAAIEQSAAMEGIRSMALWAQIPHYITGMPYPTGSLALIDGVERVTELTLPTGRLGEEASNTRARLDELVESNSQHQEMIEQLEGVFDSEPLDSQLGPLPTGDELAAELQQFLRDQND